MNGNGNLRASDPSRLLAMPMPPTAAAAATTEARVGAPVGVLHVFVNL